MDAGSRGPGRRSLRIRGTQDVRDANPRAGVNQTQEQNVSRRTRVETYVGRLHVVGKDRPRGVACGCDQGRIDHGAWPVAVTREG